MVTLFLVVITTCAVVLLTLIMLSVCFCLSATPVLTLRHTYMHTSICDLWGILPWVHKSHDFP